MNQDKKENLDEMKLSDEKLEQVHGGEGEKDPRLPVIPIDPKKKK